MGLEEKLIFHQEEIGFKERSIKYLPRLEEELKIIESMDILDTFDRGDFIHLCEE